MSKRDEDSAPHEMEAGMTTAERRRRRRRGAGLRVPSDNVPRSRTPTAPPPPVPEDPALAMSIAYSFGNDGSGPVRRGEPAPSVIDAPRTTEIEPADFEMKTREMSAVDLEQLGLSEPGAGSTLRMARTSDPGVDTSLLTSAADPRAKTTNETANEDVDVPIDTEPTEVVTQPLPPVPAADRGTKPSSPPRLKTVALQDDDLEDVRASTQPPAAASAPLSPAIAPTGPAASSAPPPAPVPHTTKPPPLAVARPPGVEPNRTMPIAIGEVEVLDKRPVSEEPLSVPEIDISELAERAGDSGDIPIDVDDSKAKARPMRPTPAPPLPAEARRTGPTDPPATTPHAPPPPPHKAPPTPPPASAKKPPPAAVAAVITKEPSKPALRGRPWFIDLFDEDYLRTLPFLTPQATQAEAEFVIQTMNLAAGAQVLDLGCGYGRHAMELAARGFHVVGLDLSTPLLVRGGEEAHRRGLTINFIRGDMRELDFDAQFDGAYCLFSTFGYFDDETNKKTLINVARALKPGGKVLVEILNRDYVIADLPTRVWWEGDGCVVLEEVELNYFSSRIQVNRSVVFDDGRQLEQEISVRAYSLHEVGKLMHAAGFRVLEVSGGYQTRGRFFGNQSRHIIVLAERKEPSAS